MIAHEIYAFIHRGKVENITIAYSYEDANRVARAVYGDDAIAVYCNQYPCGIGDKYIDGVFFQADGVRPLPYIPTQEQEVSQLQAENQQLKAESQEVTLALADMIGGVANAQ